MFRWKFEITEGSKHLSLKELAELVFPEFWLRESDWEIENDEALGGPGLRRFWISSLGIWAFMYDVTLKKNESMNHLLVKMRMYPVLISPLLFVLIAWASFEEISLTVLMLAYVFFVIVFGVFALFILEGIKSQLKRKLKGIIRE